MNQKTNESVTDTDDNDSGEDLFKHMLSLNKEVIANMSGVLSPESLAVYLTGLDKAGVPYHFVRTAESVKDGSARIGMLERPNTKNIPNVELQLDVDGKDSKVRVTLMGNGQWSASAKLDLPLPVLEA